MDGDLSKITKPVSDGVSTIKMDIKTSALKSLNKKDTVLLESTMGYKKRITQNLQDEENGYWQDENKDPSFTHTSY